jgi:hypothetical protein
VIDNSIFKFETPVTSNDDILVEFEVKLIMNRLRTLFQQSNLILVDLDSLILIDLIQTLKGEPNLKHCSLLVTQYFPELVQNAYLTENVVRLLKSSKTTSSDVTTNSTEAPIHFSNLTKLESEFPQLKLMLLKFIYEELSAKDLKVAQALCGEHREPEYFQRLKDFKELETMKLSELEAKQKTKLNKAISAQFGEQVVLDKFDKSGKEIKRAPVVFVTTGGGDQKVY